MSKNRTPSEQLKHYKRLGTTFFLTEFLAVFTPFIAMAIANYKDWFVEYDGTKMSIASILAIGLMGLATYLVAKNKFSNSFITLILGWATATVIFFLLGEIINDIAVIMLFGLIGILGAYGLDITSKAMKKKAEKIKDAIETANKENLVDAYKEEVKTQQATKKVKIKVVKDKTTN